MLFGLIDSKPAKRSSALSWILTLAIAGGALYYALRGVDWHQIGATVAQADSLYLLIAFGTASFAMFVRSLRWGVLLSAEEKVPVGTVFWATSVGYLGNNLLPARAGELLRTAIIAARTTLSRTYVFATALTGLAMDVIVLVVLGAGAILWLPQSPKWLKESSGTMAIFGLIGMSILVALPHCERALKRVLNRLPLPEKRKPRIMNIVENFLLGLRAFHHMQRFLLFVGISFSVWWVDAVGAVLVARALHFEISFPVAILLLAGLGLGGSVPSTPGYVGIFQAVAVAILPPFGFSKSDAIAYILVFQVLSYAVFFTWGFIGLWRLKRPQAQPAEPDETPQARYAQKP